MAVQIMQILFFVPHYGKNAAELSAKLVKLKAGKNIPGLLCFQAVDYSA